jgi:hypothetical protein
VNLSSGEDYTRLEITVGTVNSSNPGNNSTHTLYLTSAFNQSINIRHVVSINTNGEDVIRYGTFTVTGSGASFYWYNGVEVDGGVSSGTTALEIYMVKGFRDQ